MPKIKIHRIIYKLTSPSGNSYIGKTTTTFDDRLKLHIYGANAFAKHQNAGTLDDYKCCKALCAAINKYGISYFIIEILFDDPSWTESELATMEMLQIEQYNTLSPNGYNLTTGGEGGSHSEETKAKMRIKIPLGIAKHITSYRSHNIELDGCPVHVVWYEKNAIRGYRIKDHPLCYNKRFTSATKDLILLKTECLDFIKYIESTGIKYQSNQMIRAEKGIPKGVCIHSPTCICCEFVYKKVTYTKYFTNYDEAVVWIAEKRKSLKNAL